VTPPVCIDCGRTCPPHGQGRGYRVSKGRCECCASRHRRQQAADAARPAARPLKASDSGYGPYGVARMDVAS
jgi:hypothetical protein